MKSYIPILFTELFLPIYNQTGIELSEFIDSTVAQVSKEKQNWVCFIFCYIYFNLHQYAIAISIQ